MHPSFPTVAVTVAAVTSATLAEVRTLSTDAVPVLVNRPESVTLPVPPETRTGIQAAVAGELSMNTFARCRSATTTAAFSAMAIRAGYTFRLSD
jgi:hypothetical protein